MITQRKAFHPVSPAGADRPVASAEEWLGRNRSEAKRLWEKLSPLHRKQLRVLARALALRQTKATLPEPLRARLLAALDELDRLVARIEQLLSPRGSREAADRRAAHPLAPLGTGAPPLRP